MLNRIFPVPGDFPRPPRSPRPQRCARRFEGRPGDVGLARLWLRDRMGPALVPGEVIGDALLLLSEPAANAVRHGGGGAFHVRAFLGAAHLRVQVTSEGRNPFAVEAATTSATESGPPDLPRLDAESGRGLFLVAALAHRWGRFESPRGPGVFFELDWLGPSAPASARPSPAA
ncbi:ATP-binding protein [Actinorugispora endophytica]|uniref:Anti-sigma regulatory factor (Ser/Thr protein kinase) n=1 Tax=Actinorugispora endophytica TaxID=1605990 RepID=A0A4R6V5Y5_9ACTN|nr:ATP-binding protein [Actinorugispora endophytica]TDQ54298.1 anti-sigma regulatory factor (Ser/Thr protein kinase) [Actinorugispora endophytica]